MQHSTLYGRLMYLSGPLPRQKQSAGTKKDAWNGMYAIHREDAVHVHQVNTNRCVAGCSSFGRVPGDLRGRKNCARRFSLGQGGRTSTAGPLCIYRAQAGPVCAINPIRLLHYPPQSEVVGL